MANEEILVMNMKKIQTKDLKDGMRFTDTVFIDKKNILVGPNVPVKQKDIERLLKWGIFELETAGELIPETLQSQGVEFQKGQGAPPGQPSVDVFDQAAAELGGVRPAAVQAVVKKRRTAQMGGYERRDGELHRSLKGHYQSWVDDIDHLYTLAAEEYLLDSEDSVRIANEIIDKAQTEKDELVGLTTKKGKKKTYLAVHGVNVAIYAAMLGLRLEMSAQDLLHFVLGCLYIDIGMIRVPPNVFTKETRPNPEEMRKIREHPLRGYQILVKENGFPRESGLVVLEHHERANGQGYTRKLYANQISEFGRIAAIVDTYVAMTSRRSYREEYFSFEAMRNVLSLGAANFDKQYLATFLREIGAYPVGTYVFLNNNVLGQVVATDPLLPMRPEVKILFDEFGDPVHRSEIVRLAREADLKITKALNKNDVQTFFSPTHGS
jgi:HD-GYP domain-containing protein (c-di-GMP phosphodiesterase class II)